MPTRKLPGGGRISAHVSKKRNERRPSRTLFVTVSRKPRKQR